MPVFMIEIPSVQPRLLTKTEAARYCRLSPARFAALCPVRPIEMEANRRLYDVREIDAWIDSLKDGSSGENDEDIIAKL